MSYPVKLSVDYHDQSDRVSVLLRVFLMIPIAIIFIFVAGLANQDANSTENSYILYGGGFIFIPTLIMILFREKYPKWWFEWNIHLLKFALRFTSYVFLLTDDYPSTDEEQNIHLEIPYPEVKKDLNRYLVLIKWLLAIPHVIILCILISAVILLTPLVWIIILFTGQYPKNIFAFVVGVLRWDIRVFAYTILLTTDIYPPFTLNEA